MKKFWLLLLSLLTALSLSFAVACDDADSTSESQDSSPVIEDSSTEDSNSSGNDSSSSGNEEQAVLAGVEYLSGVTNLELGADAEFEELVLKLSYSDGTSKEATYAELDKSALTVTCDTSKLGAATAEIEYNGFSVEAGLRVYCWADSVTVPASISAFASNKGATSNFKDKTQGYLVGDDGAFSFSPIVAAYDADGKLLYFDAPGEVEIVATLYLLTEEEYVEVSDMATYVEVDALNASFDFTESAIGNSFKLVVYPRLLEDAGEDAEVIAELSNSLEFKVIDGYNVYTAADLLLWDNNNADVAAFRAEKGVTVDASTVNTLVLHNNISLTASDIPSCHIYDEVRDADHFAGLSNEKKARLQGSLKDYAFIMDRHLGDNGQFTFEGNYFTLDASAVPYVMKESGDDNLERLPTSIVSHASLFRIRGTAHSDGTTATENFDIRNVNLIGNLNRQETVESSGGLILAKFELAKGTTYNMVSKSWYINNFVSENATGHEVVIDSCIFEDSYNSLLYIWGGLVEIKNSRIYGAGGPAIIADHVSPDDDTAGRTGSGGWTSHIVIDEASEVASYVTGKEAWFAEFNAQSAVGQIMATDAIFNSFNRTFVTKTTDEGGNTQSLLNLMIVIKSGDAEGMAFNPILGKVEIGENHKLNFEGAYTAPFLAGLSKMGAPIFQGATEAGIIAYGGQDPATDGATPLVYTLTGLSTMTHVNFLAGEHLALPIAGDSGYLNLFYAQAGSAGYMGIVLGDYRALK